MTTRRGFLAGLAAVGAAPGLGWAQVGGPAWLAAARQSDGSFALFGIDPRGALSFAVPLPARGHAGAGHPSRAEAVVFARRPGAYALVIDCATGAVRHRLAPPDGRQFNGHGTFAQGGARLFTSEQQSHDSQGIIGVWDVSAGYARIAEFPSGGIGPHDLRLMPDGQALVVANGGIATDPTDRTRLNLPTMRPNLSYLTLAGIVAETVELPVELHPASIRHLAVRGDGLVAFALQWEGAPDLTPPLLGLHRRGRAPELARAPLADERAMQGYAGSVAFSGEGGQIALTSPRGGRLHRFDDTGAFLGAVSRADVCGLAPRPGGFLASDGLGGLIALEGGDARPLAAHPCAWDNHIVAL